MREFLHGGLRWLSAKLLRMPRRQRTSFADDVTNLLVRLPWWGCLLFGLVAYVFLHAFATRPNVVAPAMANLPGVMVDSVLRGAAFVGQYFLPLLSVVAALMSFLGHRKLNDGLPRATDGGFAVMPGSACPPPCPKCSRPMNLKTAKRGRNAGGKSCTGYPKSCNGTLAA